MTYKNVEAVNGGDRSGFQNHFITAGDSSDFEFDDAINIDNLQRDLTEHLQRHRRIRRLYRCFGCGGAKSLLKMSSYPAICRDCVGSLNDKGKTAKNNFVEKVKANFGKFLRGAVAANG